MCQCVCLNLAKLYLCVCGLYALEKCFSFNEFTNVRSLRYYVRLFRCVRFSICLPSLFRSVCEHMSVRVYVCVCVLLPPYLSLYVRMLCLCVVHMQRVRAFEHCICSVRTCMENSHSIGLALYQCSGAIFLVYASICMENATSTTVYRQRQDKTIISESSPLVAMQFVCFHLLFGGKYNQMSAHKIPLALAQIEQFRMQM